MGHHEDVRGTRLPNPNRLITPAVTAILLAGLLACGRKGDPVPRPRAEARPCAVRWMNLRTLEITLPVQDVREQELLGLQSVRVYHLPLGAGRPTSADVLTRGEVMLERSRPDLPKPGSTFRLELEQRGRMPGWIVVVAVRVGGTLGQPSETLPWLHPSVQ